MRCRRLTQKDVEPYILLQGLGVKVRRRDLGLISIGNEKKTTGGQRRTNGQGSGAIAMNGMETVDIKIAYGRPAKRHKRQKLKFNRGAGRRNENLILLGMGCWSWIQICIAEECLQSLGLVGGESQGVYVRALWSGVPHGSCHSPRGTRRDRVPLKLLRAATTRALLQGKPPLLPL